jgi:hypothetical protein
MQTAAMCGRKGRGGGRVRQRYHRRCRRRDPAFVRSAAAAAPAGAPTTLASASASVTATAATRRKGKAARADPFARVPGRAPSRQPRSPPPARTALSPCCLRQHLPPHAHRIDLAILVASAESSSSSGEHASGETAASLSLPRPTATRAQPRATRSDREPHTYPTFCTLPFKHPRRPPSPSR